MRVKLLLLLISFFILACEEEKEEPKYFNSKFYPVNKLKYGWEKDEFFSNHQVSLRLESRIDFEEWYTEGRFEPILENTAEIFINRDLIVGNDTIKKKNNLLQKGVAEINLYKVPRNGDSVPDSYIFWINKKRLQDFSLNKGYFTVNFKAITQNSYLINDSIIIYIK